MIGIDTIKALRDQKPWARRRFVTNLREWCEVERRKSGWYSSLRNPVYVTQTEPQPYVSHADFRYLSSPGLSAYKPRHIAQRVWQEPERFWCALQNVFLYSTDGAVRSISNDCFNELSPNWETHLGLTPTSQRDRYWSLEPTVTVDVPSTVIAVPGYDSYYHWLLQLVPRALNIMSQIEAIHRVYVPHGMSNFQIDFLTSIGVPQNILVEIKPKRRYLIHNLLVSSIPGVEGALSQWAIECLRTVSHTNASTPHTKVYLVRGGRRRRVLNEDAVIAACEARGFEIVDGSELSISEQIRKLSRSTHIVAAHGAALSNMVFAQNSNVLARSIHQDCVHQ